MASFQMSNVSGVRKVLLDGVDITDMVRDVTVEVVEGVPDRVTVVYACFEAYATDRATVHHYCPVVGRAVVESPAEVDGQLTVDEVLRLVGQELPDGG